MFGWRFRMCCFNFFFLCASCLKTWSWWTPFVISWVAFSNGQAFGWWWTIGYIMFIRRRFQTSSVWWYSSLYRLVGWMYVSFSVAWWMLRPSRRSRCLWLLCDDLLHSIPSSMFQKYDLFSGRRWLINNLFLHLHLVNVLLRFILNFIRQFTLMVLA